MKLVSVLVLSYNAQSYINECLESIIFQDYPNIEIILGDDCSTDDTLSIASNKLNESSMNYQIRKSTENEGSYSNLLNSLNLCKGEYIAYLESDDYWISEDKISNQVKLLEENTAYSSCVTESYRKRNNRLTPYRKNKKTIFKTTDLFGYTPFHSSTLLFRRTTLPQLPQQLKNIDSNDKLLYILLSTVKPIFLMSEKTSVYNEHPSNITNSNSFVKIQLMQIKFLLMMVKYFKYQYLFTILFCIVNLYLRNILHYYLKSRFRNRE